MLLLSRMGGYSRALRLYEVASKNGRSSLGHSARITGQRATVLRSVANYVPCPHLQQQIKEQLHDKIPNMSDTRILTAQALGGSSKLQLVLSLYVGISRRPLGHLLSRGGIESVDRAGLSSDLPTAL